MKRKAVLMLVLSLITLLALAPVTSAFGDIKGSKGEKHINHLKQRGVIKGDSKGKDSFRPKDTLSYAQAVVMFDQAFDLNLHHIRFVKEPKVSDVYTKVKDNAWYAQAFLDGYYNGVEFQKDVNPNASISREEFAAHLITLLDRKADYALIERYVEYKDDDKVKKEYRDEIQKLLLLKIEELGKDNKFNPKQAITREEAAIWLDKVLTFIDELSNQPIEEEPKEPTNLWDIAYKTEKINNNVNKVIISATVAHPGYSFEISTITFEGDTATIKLKQLNPDPDMFYPQVITEVSVETYVASKYKIKVVTN